MDRNSGYLRIDILKGGGGLGLRMFTGCYSGGRARQVNIVQVAIMARADRPVCMQIDI